MPEPLAPYTVLQSRYRILQVLGGGGMGRVYLAEDLRLAGVYVAVKELVDTYLPQAERPQAVQLFYQEAAQLARLRHPAIPHVTGYFGESNRLYMVMEYVPGENLDSVLNRTSGFLPETVLRDWAIQLCAVLEYLHSQQPPVIFRDLKPANGMLMPDGRLKLVDFGIARLFDPHKATDTIRMGTLGYAPPEQYAGRGQTDALSDIYALGATLHHLATRRDPRHELPFSFPPPRQLNPALSSKFERTIMRALSYDRAQRFPSTTAMRQALQTRVASSGSWPAQASAQMDAIAGCSGNSLDSFANFCGYGASLAFYYCASYCCASFPIGGRSRVAHQHSLGGAGHGHAHAHIGPQIHVYANSYIARFATRAPHQYPIAKRPDSHADPDGYRTGIDRTRGRRHLSGTRRDHPVALAAHQPNPGRRRVLRGFGPLPTQWRATGGWDLDKDTSWNLAEHAYLCERADGGRLEWFVTVKRKTGTTPEGWNTGVAVGPSSTRRSLTWQCETAPPPVRPTEEPTPTVCHP